ncbi:MAG: uracil-DNA glycosylase [Desulfuromonadales bacterium]|nr:uracil-DNA glycosylase [Desulfuromonadales bacterium]
MSADNNESDLGCRSCRRLHGYLSTLAPRRGLQAADYWGRAVPGFGDRQGRVCLVGLAPGAHGANRTGRPFTGDGAGDFMYPLLHRAGFANQGEAVEIGDGLVLHDLFITNAVKCAPPENRPTPAEFAACRPKLAADLAALPRLRVVLALGREAFNSVLQLLREQGRIERLRDYPFGHGREYPLPGGPIVVASYHTSRYNVQTGRLTEAMFLTLLDRVRLLAAGEND